MREHEKPYEIKENAEAIESLKTAIEWSEGNSIIIVTCPESADFDACGLRLKAIIEEMIRDRKIDDQNIEVISVLNPDETLKIDRTKNNHEDKLDMKTRYNAVKTASANESKRITIWIAPNRIVQGRGNALAELGPLIAMNGIEVVLAPNTINQQSAWIDFWSRRSTLLPVFI